MRLRKWRSDGPRFKVEFGKPLPLGCVVRLCEADSRRADHASQSADYLHSKTKMTHTLRVAQFWRDTVNGDLLKILEIDTSDSCLLAGCERPIPYARCACYPRGEYFLGIQEMKASHFEEERFQRVGWFKSLWCKLKIRRSQPPLA